MITNRNKQNSDKDIKSKLDNFLTNSKQTDCSDEDCLVNNPEEIVKRENKRIITSDGRQLLSEYKH